MASVYTIKLSNDTPLVDLLSLESNGAGNESTPRQILEIKFDAGVHAFVIADDVTSRFNVGMSFQVFGSTYSGTYTVHPDGPTYADGKTTIPINESLVFDDYTIVGVSAASNYWKVESNGNAGCIFYPGTTFGVSGNSFGLANDVYTVVSSASSSANTIVGVSPGVGGTWTVAGDQTQFYTPGTTFRVRGNGVGDGDYTVVSSSLSGNTIVTVAETIPVTAGGGVAILTPVITRVNVTPGSIPIGATVTGVATPDGPVTYALSAPPAIVVVSAGVFDITWRIAGNHTTKLLPGCSFAIRDNSFYDYAAFEITNVSFSLGTTHITTRVSSATTPTPDGTGSLVHPAPTIPFGFLQYSVPYAASSLQLIGKGAPYFNSETSWGAALMNNTVHITENFANSVPPTAPLVGQLWFDSNTNTHRVFNQDFGAYEIIDVVTGVGGSFTAVGDLTADPLFQPGETVIVYNDTGMGAQSQAFTIASTTLVVSDTVIEMVEPVPLNAMGNGYLYAVDSLPGLVTTGIPVLGDVDMNDFKIINLGDATSALDALNMQTGDARYVNVTGDSMSGDLTMGASADIFLTDGNLQLNGGSDISFPGGTTGGIFLAGDNDIVFSGTGQIDMGTNKIINLGTPTLGTDATTKAYVDTYVSGIVYISPVKDPNIYNDSLDTPPGSPLTYHRTYIVKPGAFTITGRVTGASGRWIISGNHAARFTAGNTFVVNGNSDGPSNGTYTVASAANVAATTEITISGSIPGTAGTNGTVYHSVGAWNGKDGHVMVYNGTAWVDVLDRAVIAGDRFGVYAEPDNDEVPIDTTGASIAGSAGGSFLTHAGKIGTIQAGVVGPGYTVLGTAPAWSFYTPVEPDAFSVTGDASLHFGHAYTFRGTHGGGVYNQDFKWIEFCGPTAIIDGAGLSFTGNTLNIGAGNAITIGTNTVSVADNPTLPGTAHFIPPSGTTGQRSGTTNGQTRFNTSNTKFEGYEGAWRDFVTAVNGEVTSTRLAYGAAAGSVLTGSDAFTVNTTTLSFQHAAGNFAVAGDAKTGQYVAKVSTANNTQTELLVNGGQRLVLANDSTWKFDIHVVARRTDADNESAAYTFEGCIDRNGSAATTALVGTVLSTVVAEDTVAWDVAVDADTTNGALRIRVTGENAKTIRWVAFVRTVEVTG